MLTADQIRFTLAVKSEEESSLVAKELASIFEAGNSIGLIGDLGAGKTTFSKLFVRFLQIEVPVQSPSFVLENIYSNDRLTVQHWDLYRLSQLPEELLDPPDQHTIRIIEWPDRIPEFAATLELLIKIDFDLENFNNSWRSYSFAGPLAEGLEIRISS